jgi:hypothetical protein
MSQKFVIRDHGFYRHISVAGPDDSEGRTFRECKKELVEEFLFRRDNYDRLLQQAMGLRKQDVTGDT